MSNLFWLPDDYRPTCTRSIAKVYRKEVIRRLAAFSFCLFFLFLEHFLDTVEAFWSSLPGCLNFKFLSCFSLKILSETTVACDLDH